MRIDRINRLIAVMQERAQQVAKADETSDEGPVLDMGSWLDDIVPEDKLNGEVPPALLDSMGYSQYAGRYLKEGFCGTTACMAGYGALDPELSRQGLRIAILSTPGLQTRLTLITYEGQEGFRALASFFDISSDAAHALFGGEGGSAVAERFGLTDFEGAVAALTAFRDKGEAALGITHDYD